LVLVGRPLELWTPLLVDLLQVIRPLAVRLRWILLWLADLLQVIQLQAGLPRWILLWLVDLLQVIQLQVGHHPLTLRC